MPSRKLNASDRIALAAVVIAIISIVVSVRSCQQTERSLRLSEREFEESHSTFWTGTVDDKNVLRLVPSNPDVKIQAAWITFPKPFKSGAGDTLGPEGQLRPPDYSVSIQEVRNKIAEMIKKDTIYTNGIISTPALDTEGKPAILRGHTEPIGIGIQQGRCINRYL